MHFILIWGEKIVQLGWVISINSHQVVTSVLIFIMIIPKCTYDPGPEDPICHEREVHRQHSGAKS